MAVEALADWRGSTQQREAPARSETGQVIAFQPRKSGGNRFSLYDRSRLDEWQERARAVGVCRVSIEGPDPDDDQEIVGDFAMIYDACNDWARWAVAPSDGHYLLWSPNSGKTIGNFPSLHAALATICSSDD